jgi:hypothetical protein
MERNAGERDFIAEHTRSLLVRWADHCIREGCLPDRVPHIYLECAKDKGWLTKGEPHKLTSKGYKTAAAFLRR